MVELRSIKAIKQGLEFLFLPRVQNKLKEHFFLFRKYLDSPKLSKKGFQAVRNCWGVTIGHLSGGYFVNLTAMPKDSENPSPSLLAKYRYREVAMEALNEVKTFNSSFNN